MSYLLGLSYNYHDAAAVLLKDGGIVAASTEERHTRRKHDHAFPAHAIEFCLRQAEISPRQIDNVVYHEQPMVKFDRIFKTTAKRWRHGGRVALQDTLKSWAVAGKFDVKDQIGSFLDLPHDQIHFCNHHLSHAASAYFCSPFRAATIVTLDGVGEWETCTICRGEGDNITKLRAMRIPHSLGLFYSVFTAFLGFEVNEGEYKLMGMAGFGRPIFAEQMMQWFDLKGDGTFLLRQDLFDWRVEATIPFRQALTDLLGPPRVPEAEFDPERERSEAPGTALHYANVAASAQLVTEKVVEHVVSKAVNKTHLPALCLAGGVALNSAANQRVRRLLRIPMYVQPAAGDAGCALGAAKWFHHCVEGQANREVLQTAALGQEYSESEILEQVNRNYPQRKWTEYPDTQTLCQAVARLLADGKIVGWFQGRAEWGPRALGQRSILADPRPADMRERVNRTIKFREAFRPFAPAVLFDRAAEFFELIEVPDEDSRSSPYAFMLAVCRVRDEYRSCLPAITHVDGTARVQTVRPDINPLFYQLISEFDRQSTMPILLNTSFNLRSEPIVNSPEDAIKTFEWSNLDALALGGIVVLR